ncbi:MAG: discoidin domain-containing protein, partial [Paludibacteraceae bacterium]|nr:discoidin domain-containing protein [Paludibacteraceae bacterium]
GYDQYGNEMAVPNPVFSVSAENDALKGTITNNGFYTASGYGMVKITVTSGNLTSSINLAINPADVASKIAIVPNESVVVRGGELQLKAILYNQIQTIITENATLDNWYIIGNAQGSTVNAQGLFTAGENADGNISVVGEYRGIKDTCLIHVSSFNNSNLATLKPAYSSSRQYNTFEAEKANDLNITSRFAPKTPDNEWWYVDLEGNYLIDKIVIRWYSYAKEYSVEISADKKNWVTVYQTEVTPTENNTDFVKLPAQVYFNNGVDDSNGTTNVTQTVQTINVNNVVCRYVRIIVNRSRTAYAFSFYEFEVYGESFWNPVATTMNIAPLDEEVYVGKDIQYVAEVFDQDGVKMTGAVVDWSINNNDGGYFMDDAWFTPTQEGTYIITAKVDKGDGTFLTKSTSVVVKPAPVPSRIVVNPSKLNADNNKTYQLSATVYDQYGNEMPFVEPTWETDATEITVNQVGGVTTGNQNGTFKITVSAGSVKAYGYVLVGVEDNRPNLALNKTSKTDATGGYPSKNAVDGSEGSRWSVSGVDDPASFFVDLGDIYKIEEIQILWEHRSSAYDYNIYVSNDANSWNNDTNWTSFLELRNMDERRYCGDDAINPGANCKPLHVHYKSSLARYIKVKCIQKQPMPVNGDNYSIVELRVFGEEVDRNIPEYIEITPTISYLEIGQTQQFTATVYNGFGEVLNVPVTWTCDVAGMLNNTGLFTASRGGSFTVEVRADETTVATAGVTVNAPLKPDAPSAIVMSGNRCVGSTVTMSVNAIPGNTFTWTVPAGAQIVSGQGTNSVQVRWTGEVNGTVSVTTNAGGLDSDPSELAVQVSNFAVGNITASNTEINCTTTAVDLSVPAGNTYRWSNNSTSNSINVTAGGAYRVTVTNAEGCTSSASVSVSEDKAQPNVSINTANTELTCTRTVITLSASGAANYDWGSATKEVTIGSVYTVVGTNANGCSNTASVTITESNDKPNVGIQVSGDKLTCLVQSITLS